jgi:DNA-binding SARP family transcriptional activator
VVGRLEGGKEALQCGAADVLDFRILGPFEAVDHEPLSLGGRKQQAVLVALLLHRGEVVTADRLIEAVWDGRAPATASKTLQVYISNLRKALGDGHLVTQAGGYMLAAGRDQVDAARFVTLAATGRDALKQGDPEGARKLLEGALGLWRGPALADFAYDSFAQPEIARLEEARLVALEDRIDADLRLGKHAALVPELEALVQEHPLRERLYELLMVALYRSGRQVDALDRYRRARAKLIEEFGVEPGPRLQQIQSAVLSQDAALDLPEAAPAAGTVRPGRRRAWALVASAGAIVILVVVLLATGAGGKARPAAVAAGTVEISAPASGGLYAKGERVPTRFSCAGTSREPAVASCRDSVGVTTVTGGTGQLDTSTLGSQRYTVVMTLKNGAKKSASISYAIVPLRTAIDVGRAIAADARTSITLVCLGGGQGATCHGTLSFTRGGVLLATGSYALPAGAMRSFRLAVTHAGTAALTRAPGHRLRVRVTATLAFAPSTERTITLRRGRL